MSFFGADSGEPYSTSKPELDHSENFGPAVNATDYTQLYEGSADTLRQSLHRRLARPLNGSIITPCHKPQHRGTYLRPRNRFWRS